jgi:hypothetical protein
MAMLVVEYYEEPRRLSTKATPLEQSTGLLPEGKTQQ